MKVERQWGKKNYFKMVFVLARGGAAAKSKFPFYGPKTKVDIFESTYIQTHSRARLRSNATHNPTNGFCWLNINLISIKNGERKKISTRKIV